MADAVVWRQGVWQQPPPPAPPAPPAQLLAEPLGSTTQYNGRTAPVGQITQAPKFIEKTKKQTQGWRDTRE